MSESLLHLETDVLDLRPAHPFVIARGGRKDFRTVWVRLVDGSGAQGWGEAAPNPYYGETPETVLAALAAYASALPAQPSDVKPFELEGAASLDRSGTAPSNFESAAPFELESAAYSLEAAEHRWKRLLPGNPSARAALSAAWHDLTGKRLGVPLYRMLGLDPASAPRSSFTIGIDTPESMRAKVAEAAAYPIFKIKLGTDRDLEILRTIREATDKEIRVDANAAWTAKDAIAMLPALYDFGVTVLEQPVAAGDLVGLAEVCRCAAIPIIADESCLTSADIPKLAGVVDGINIKLAKCGGLREALRMVTLARAHGLRVMLGCMIESSLGITAAAHLAPLVDIVDLDGAALLANDPFLGATIDGGQLALPAGPGLGVRRR